MSERQWGLSLLPRRTWGYLDSRPEASLAASVSERERRREGEREGKRGQEVERGRGVQFRGGGCVVAGRVDSNNV